MHHLNCATFCPVGRLLINGRGSPFEPGRLVVHCQLIETRDGTRLHNQRRLRELADFTGKGRVRVFCSHDPEMMRQFAPHTRAAVNSAVMEHRTLAPASV